MFFFGFLSRMCICMLVAQLCPTLCEPMNCSPEAPPSLEFSRQGYWNGLTFPFPGDLPDPGIEPRSSCIAGRFFTAEPPGKLFQIIFQYKLLQDIAPCYTLGPCLDFFYHYNITHSRSGKTIDLKSILSLTSFVY